MFKMMDMNNGNFNADFFCLTGPMVIFFKNISSFVSQTTNVPVFMVESSKFPKS